MFKTITAWAMLTTSTLIAPISATTFIGEDQKPEITNNVEATRTSYTPIPIPVTVPATADISFDRVGMTSKQAPKPKIVEPKVEEAAAKAIAAQEVQHGSTSPSNIPATPVMPAQPAQPTPTITVAPGSSKEEAKRQLAGYGWGEDQFSCLVSLWEKESNWNHNAANPSSGAYGIPQSLPGNKMASAGADWQTNPATQIKWGLEYIQGRYQTPCGAWGHSIAVGWY